MKISFKGFSSRRCLFIALLISLIMMGYLWRVLFLFPLHTVAVSATYQQVSPAMIQNALEPLTHTTFFRINLKKIQRTLVALPWVETVELGRQWPDTLLVTIHEVQPKAIWNQQDMLTASGQLLEEPKTFHSGLPKLLGPANQQAKILETFYTMSELLAPLELNIIQLSLSPYDAWEIKLDTGTTLMLGSRDYLSRLQRFVSIYPEILGSRSIHPQQVDLRYPHGLAVRWNKSNGEETG